MEKLQNRLLLCKITGGVLFLLHFSLIVTIFANVMGKLWINYLVPDWIVFFISDRTDYPSDQVLVIGILLTVCTSQLCCSIAMLIGAFGSLTPLLWACSGYLIGFLFYFFQSFNELKDIDNVKDGFRYACLGKVQLTFDNNVTKLMFPCSFIASVWMLWRACKCRKDQEPEGPARQAEEGFYGGHHLKIIPGFRSKTKPFRFYFLLMNFYFGHFGFDIW